MYACVAVQRDTAQCVTLLREQNTDFQLRPETTRSVLLTIVFNMNSMSNKKYISH